MKKGSLVFLLTAFAFLAAGSAWAKPQIVSMILAGGRLSGSNPQNDTLKTRIWSFDECKRRAEEIFNDEAKGMIDNADSSDRNYFKELFHKAKITKWAVYLGGDEKPREYEYLFESDGSRLVAIHLYALSGRFMFSSGSILGHHQSIEDWKTRGSYDKGPIATFEKIPGLQQTLKGSGINTKETYQLYSLEEDVKYVIFKDSKTNKDVIYILNPEGVALLPRLDPKVNFEELKMKDREFQKKIIQKEHGYLNHGFSNNHNI